MPLPFAQSASTVNAARLQRNCMVCGFQNLEVDLRCQKCGRRLQPMENSSTTDKASNVPASLAAAPVPVAAPVVTAPPAPAMPEHVRNEIHTRVERFKARRRTQTLPLPFEEPVLPEAGNVVLFPTLEPEPAIKISRSRASRETTAAQSVPPAKAVTTETPVEPAEQAATAPAANTPVLPETWLPAHPLQETATSPMASAVIAAPEPAPAAPIVPQFPLFVPPAEQPSAEWQRFQIATLGKRLSGIMHDLGNILGGIALFAAPFYWIAGKPYLNLHLLAAFLMGAMLISLLYGTLFLVVIGETPGMTAVGLRVVSFSGHRPSRQQRMLRAAGALISAGSFLFGYLWACVDEEKLYWHDHISKTVLTDSAE